MLNRELECRGECSRRDFIRTAAVAAGGAVIAVGFISSASAEQKKLSQQQAHYQPVPKSGHRCQTCALWKPPTECASVEGQVSPAGWCMLYQPKS